MGDEVEGSGEIQEKGCSQLMSLCCIEPEIIQVDESSDSAVVGEPAVVVRVEESIVDEILKDLVKYGIFHHLADLYNVGDWAVI